MPLSAPLTELLATIKDESRRKMIVEEFEANPTLQERFAGNLRQEDYDRKFNESKATLAQIEAARVAADQRAKTWQDWADKNIPIHKQLVESHQAVQAERDRLAEQVRLAAEAAANGNGDDPVNKAEMLSIVNQRIEDFKKNNGSPTAAQIQQIVNDTATKMAQGLEKQFLEKTFPESMNTVLQTANLQIKYAREFGKEMDPMAFMEFMAKRNAATPTTELYEEFIRPERDTQQKTAHEKEIKDKVDAAVKQALSNQNVPGSSTNGVPMEMGQIQLRRANVPEDKGGLPKLPEDLELGTNQIGRAHV